MDIRQKYRKFLRKYVDNKYLSEYENVEVLGENFINNYYIVIFESTPSIQNIFNNLKYRGIIFENVKNPKCAFIHIERKRDDYLAGYKYNLKSTLKPYQYDFLVKHGLYYGKDVGYNKNNSMYALQRLVLCIYDNIFNCFAHHINKIKYSNAITNLLPVNPEQHDYLDHFDINLGLTKKLQKNFKEKVLKNKKTTLAYYNENVLTILNLKEKGYSVKQIEKFLKHKIKKSTIYNIIKEFYLRKDFLKFLENEKIQEFSENDGIILKRWKNIKEFDDL